MMAETIDVLIKNGNVIDPDDRKISKRSIAIRNGKIVDYDPDVIYNVKDEIVIMLVPDGLTLMYMYLKKEPNLVLMLI